MSNVQVTEINGLKIYNLTGGRSLYDIMKDSNFSIKKLKKNEEYVNRIEIIQDFEYPVASGCLKISDDGNYMFSSGIYPPRLKIFDLNEMSLKCERGFDSEIRKIELMSDNYTKAAVLCEDRSIEIHAQYGKHFKTRIPKYGRDMAYHKTSCDLYSVGNTNEIYRLNLYEGQFLKPFETSAEAINACSVNSALEILGIAGEKGIVELWDLKDKKKIVGLPILESGLFKNYDFSDCTSINFSADGLLMGVGNANGKVNVYDLRNPKPLYTVNHAYKLPIKKVKFHEHSHNIITVDRKLAKFSNMKTGKAFTNIETKYDINDFETCHDSGMFFFACESPKAEIYFIPGIGPAPKWCSFLDNITEELEEAKTYSLYEDYKFLTGSELEQIGATELIGTKLVKPYMHGFFMDWKLYKKLKALAEPFSYEKYVEEKREEKLKKMFGDRIIMNRAKKVKVNSKLIESVDGEENVESKANLLKSVVQDQRFAKLFEDKNYEIDFTSEKFKSAQPKNKKLNIETQETLIEKENENEAKSEKIINPELIRLKEKLIQKKRQRIDKLHQNDFDRGDKSLEQRVVEEADMDEELDEDEINRQINKIVYKETGRKKIKPKITSAQIKDKLKNKRVLAGSDKLTLTKFR